MFNSPERVLIRGSQRYYFYFIFSIIIIVLTSFGTFEIIKRTELLKLEKIDIVGDSDALNFHLEKELQVFQGVNLYQFDLDSIVDTLRFKYPVIKELKINRRILNTLKVKYGLEKPFSILNFKDGKNYYLTKDLKIIESVNYGYLQESLPVISANLDSEDYEIGAEVQDSIVNVMNDYLISILEERPDFQDKISDIFWENGKVYLRDIFRGNVLYFGNNDLSKKITLYMSHFSSFSSGLYIDVSYENQIITKKSDF